MKNENNYSDRRMTREQMEEYRIWYENWRRDHWNEKFRKLRAQRRKKNRR